MEQRQLGTAGVRVSALGLGTMTFGRECDEAASRAILDRYREGTSPDARNFAMARRRAAARLPSCARGRI